MVKIRSVVAITGMVVAQGKEGRGRDERSASFYMAGSRRARGVVRFIPILLSSSVHFLLLGV